MRRHIVALALLAALVSPVPASAQMAIIDFVGEPTAVPDNNDFQSDLLGLGYTHYTATDADIWLTADATLSFFFLGSESAFTDTFQVPGAGISFTELGGFSDSFGAPIYLGAGAFSATSLAGLLGFTTTDPDGDNAGLGDEGFGIFLQRGQESGDGVTSFILGYDDYINQTDDNHDDLMILVQVGSAVPEPGTWAMLLFGFGALGAAMRRKSKAPRVRAAIA
jgi:hypothetical protein